MKRLILLAIISLSVGYCFSQRKETTTLGLIEPYPIGDMRITSNDTTVFYIGRKNCKHDLVAQKNVTSGYMGIEGTSCAVYHEFGGCPDIWTSQNFICVVCLFHFNIKAYLIIESVEKTDRYKEAVKKLRQKN